MTIERPMFPPRAESADSFLAHLAIQQRERQTALLRLRRLRKEAMAEIDRLIAFLDASDPYVMTELEDDGDREEVGDAEPSLGSFDRMIDQEKSYKRHGWWDGYDYELDDCDREEDDPPELSEVSGIGDMEGLLEQIGYQDWTHTVMA